MSDDRIGWRCDWLLEKWLGDVDSVTARALGLEPFETIHIPGNLGLNEGITNVLQLLIGASGITPYSAANARIGVGDSTTAAAATQTDLQAGTNKLYVGMNSSYPSVSAQTVTFQSDFSTSQANFAWQEWTIDNGATSHLNLNRKVQSLGTKPNTETWTLTGAVTLA